MILKTIMEENNNLTGLSLSICLGISDNNISKEIMDCCAQNDYGRMLKVKLSGLDERKSLQKFGNVSLVYA